MASKSRFIRTVGISHKISREPTLGTVNPLPLLFKALLHGQKDHVFFSGHLNLRTTPETGLPSRKKNHNN